MSFTEAEYTALYNRAYVEPLKSGGWRSRDTQFRKLMAAARAKRDAERRGVPFPHRHRTERHAGVNRDGESVIIETRY